MSVRTEILKWAFALYAISILTSMAVMSIGAALLMAAWVGTSIWGEIPGKKIKSKFKSELKSEFKDEWNQPHSRLYFCLSLFLAAACVFSLIVGFFFPLGYGGKFVEIHFLKDMGKIWYLLWPLILVIGLRRLDNNDRQWIFNVWIAAFGVLSAFGIIQYFIGWPKYQVIPTNVSRYHATLFLGHHLSVSSIFIFPFFAALDYAFLCKNRKSLYYLGAVLLGGITLFLTFSRSLWVALPLGVLIWSLWTLPKRWSLLSLGIILFGIFIGTQYGPIAERLHANIGIKAREALWLANLEFFKQRPISGVGWHHNLELSGYYLMDKYHTDHVFSGHAHNDLLDMMGGTGLLGTLAWIAWWVGLFWIGAKQWILCRKASKAQALSTNDHTQLNFIRGLICAWIVFQINGLTQVNFWEAKVEHQLAWVIAWALL